jgi:hypothetical protein
MKILSDFNTKVGGDIFNAKFEIFTVMEILVMVV